MASVPSEPSWGPAAATASSTTTATVLETAPLQANTPETLHLVLNPRPQNNVQWTEDTVDNEHMNKKKSKKCCIYNKPREFGESSSESEGSEDDGSDVRLAIGADDSAPLVRLQMATGMAPLAGIQLPAQVAAGQDSRKCAKAASG
eukprot:CAMPEP_0172674608 /NCGR_PEP_ID=MMETSP1074-20121228/12829_1 /TAXON_ID=2916 /ORGANISM="Ceratium fusus, Strain PA161109" /LENGTH=145 /DNA_ID=CAMNT_0013492031 /DNA_START=73 /DNA_END=511 /DNA_ORIENTATION=+